MRTRLALCVAALLALPAVASAQPKKIVIDPGHGGEDPGAVGNGMEEQAVNVDVGLKFKAMLEADTAVVLNADDLNARNLYVALTRGARKLVVCASVPLLGV